MEYTLAGLYIVTVVLVVVSFAFDREKTWAGIRGGARKLGKILPNYLKLLILIAVALFFAEGLIVTYLGAENAFLGLLAGMLLGSVTMIPGFIAYPLAGVLVDRGVLYMVVAGFVTTLMMVGVLTYPLERAYLGVRGTIIRNTVSLLVAAVISVAIGLVYGELTGGAL
ncbi:MAG: hypothetical protein EA427_02945 [Spirochaetaceae bacterium]|nr:MAG: hypothetical protein EA427_02945 [Spirochaetaceae bacterium]